MRSSGGGSLLYISGYAPEAILGRGVENLGGSLLPKPFTPDGLIRRVRDVLDGPRHQGP